MEYRAEDEATGGARDGAEYSAEDRVEDGAEGGPRGGAEESKTVVRASLAGCTEET